MTIENNKTNHFLLKANIPLFSGAIDTTYRILKNALAQNIQIAKSTINFIANRCSGRKVFEEKLKSALTRNEFETLAQSPIADFELIRRIPNDEWNNLKKLLNSLSALDNSMIEAFQLGNWNDPIFRNQNWTLYAFKAYLRGDLSKERLSALLLYDTCMQLRPGEVTCCKVFDGDGNIDLKGAGICIQGAEYLTLNREEQLLDQLSTIPPEETQFFLVPVVPKTSQSSPAFEIIEETLFPSGFLFGKVEIDQQVYLAVFPPTLLTEIIRVRSGKSLMQPHPVMGFSEAADFKSAVMRDIFIPWEGIVASPREIHLSLSTALEVYWHDIYHIIVESFNVHREIWIALALQFEQHHLMKSEEFLLDRNFSSYLDACLHQPNPDYIDSFFITIENCLDTLDNAQAFEDECNTALHLTKDFSQFFKTHQFILELFAEEDLKEILNFSSEQILSIYEKFADGSRSISELQLEIYRTVFEKGSTQQIARLQKIIPPSSELLLISIRSESESFIHFLLNHKIRLENEAYDYCIHNALHRDLSDDIMVRIASKRG